MNQDQHGWVAEGSRAYSNLKGIRKICSDMYNLSETYLRQINNNSSDYVLKVSPQETEDTYKGRLQNALPMNHLAEGVDSASGFLLENFEVDTGDYTDPDLQEWLLDLTGDETSIEGLVSTMSLFTWLYGSAPWFIDYTRYDSSIAVNGQISQKDKMQLNLRPYVKLVSPDDLLEASPITDNGIILPGRLRIRSKYMTYWDFDTNSFCTTEKEIEEVLIITREGVEVYHKPKDKWEVKTPLQPSTNRLIAGAVLIDAYAYMMGTPPFQDVAVIQSLLMAAEADTGYITSIAQIPFLFGKELDSLGGDGKLQVGPVFLLKGLKDSDIKWIELSGKSIEAGVARIRRHSENAQAITGQIYAGLSSGEQTATSQILSMAGMKRYFARFKQSMEDNLTAMLNGMLEREGKPVPKEARVRICPKDDISGSVEPSTVVDANIENISDSAGI